MIGRDPAAIDADPRTLSVKLRRVAPLAVGLSKGRWSNIRSHLRSALELVRPMLKGRSDVAMSPEWQALFSEVPMRSDRYKLSRLLRWLSARDIRPRPWCGRISINTALCSEFDLDHRRRCEAAGDPPGMEPGGEVRAGVAAGAG